MKRLAVAIAIAVLAGCAQVAGAPSEPLAADDQDDAERPYWLRDPARGEYPYSPRGW